MTQHDPNTDRSPLLSAVWETSPKIFRDHLDISPASLWRSDKEIIMSLVFELMTEWHGKNIGITHHWWGGSVQYWKKYPNETCWVSPLRCPAAIRKPCLECGSHNRIKDLRATPKWVVHSRHSWMYNWFLVDTQKTHKKNIVSLVNVDPSMVCLTPRLLTFGGGSASEGQLLSPLKSGRFHWDPTWKSQTNGSWNLWKKKRGIPQKVPIYGSYMDMIDIWWIYGHIYGSANHQKIPNKSNTDSFHRFRGWILRTRLFLSSGKPCAVPSKVFSVLIKECEPSTWFQKPKSKQDTNWHILISLNWLVDAWWHNETYHAFFRTSKRKNFRASLHPTNFLVLGEPNHSSFGVWKWL